MTGATPLDVAIVGCGPAELFGKDTLVLAVGSADAAVAMAVGLTRYARRTRVLLPPDAILSEGLKPAIARREVELVHGVLAGLEGESRLLSAVRLADGTRLAAEAFFVSTPARGRTDLAEQLGVDLAPTGHHAAVASQRGNTNVRGVWVAGDLRPMTQQVAVALGTGSLAAVMVDQYLRKRDLAKPVEAPASEPEA